MKLQLYFIFFVLIGWVNAVILCPATKLYDESSFGIPGAVMGNRFSSIGDIYYYVVKPNSISYLYGYQFVDQSQNARTKVKSNVFLLQVPDQTVISYVSLNGLCVVIKHTDALHAYNTKTKNFVLVQQINITSISNLQSVYINDDCTFAIVTSGIQNPNSKFYKDSQVFVGSITLPALLNGKYTYGINPQSFYSLKNDGTYQIVSIPSIKSTLLFVQESSFLQSVITITSDDVGTSIVLIRTTDNSTVAYTKQFVKDTDYSGQVSYIVKSQEGVILLTDTNGFVKFISFDLINQQIVARQFSLNDQNLKSLFIQSQSKISVSNDVIFVYFNKTMTYFQAIQDMVYYLSDLDFDIEAFSNNMRKQDKSTYVYVSLISPQDLDQCYNVPDVLTPNVYIQQEIYTPSVIDPITSIPLRCPSNCLTCQSAEVCTVCKLGYTLNPQINKCIACQGCSICNYLEPTYCTFCFTPRVFNKTTKTCDLPQCTIDNCLHCDSNGTCLKCVDGYGYIDEICQKCQEGCRNCPISADSCDSSSCKNGFIYYEDPTTKKGICQPCLPGVDTCSAADMSVPLTCVDGRYISKDSAGLDQCVSCMNFCKKCSSATQCQKCQHRYIPVPDGTSCTLKCSDNCLTCDQSDATKCLTCFQGGQLDPKTNKCIVDPVCNQTANCTFCNQGSILQDGYCYDCTYKDDKCTGCLASALSTCNDCELGYFLLDNVCTICPQGCTDCFGQETCAKCEDNYFLVTYKGSETGVCKICDSHCKTCASNAFLCTSCNENFTLQGSKCISSVTVAIQFVIQANVNNFIEFMQDMINWHVTESNKGKIAGSYDIDDRYVKIQTMKKQGSSVVTSIVEGQSIDNANAVATAIHNAIVPQPFIKGYMIIYGSVTVPSQSQPDTSPQPQPSPTPNPQPQQEVSSSSSNILPLILGVSIPIGCLILIALGVVGYKLRQRKKEVTKEVKDTSKTASIDCRDSAKTFDYSQEKLDAVV